MKKWGFYDAENVFVPLPSRRFLALDVVQHALIAAQRKGVPVRCGCGGGWLLPFQDSRFHPELKMNMRRVSLADKHLRGCPAEKLGDFLGPAVVYAAGAFDEPTESTSQSQEQDNAALARAKVRYGSCTHLLHQVIAKASMLALRQANTGRNYRSRDLRPFTMEDFHGAISSTLDGIPLRSGEPLLAALAPRHREIVWGVSEKQLGQALRDVQRLDVDVELVLKGVRVVNNTAGTMDRCIRIPRNVAAHAGGRRDVQGNVIAPPYLVIAVTESLPRRERHHDVYIATRIVVVPIAGAKVPFVVDSEFERQVIVKHYGDGVAFLKQNVRYSLAELGEEFWPFGLCQNGSLPHRPDLVVYTKGRCWLVELAGFDRDPEYMKMVERRLATMIAVANHEHVRPHRVLRSKFVAI